MNIELTGENLTLDQVWVVANNPKVSVSLSDSSKKKVSESRRYIQNKIDHGDVMYGVNTGFGAFSSVTINNDQIVDLQKNLIRSHSVGIGEPFTMEETRAIMLLRANALARGHSGIRVEVIEKILEFLNKNILPIIPQQGSVGASGDLAPLSHLALSLIGEGYVWNHDPAFRNSDKEKTLEVLNRFDVSPLELQAKEGLSLINGCQVMTAVGLLTAYRARQLLWSIDVAGAMSLEALRGSRKAFDPLIASSRPHPGESETASNLLKLLGESSTIAQGHEQCNRVQDAYSLRCMPAVHGAAKNTLKQVIKTLEIEANSSTDNPLVFSEEGKILSCGNFHGEPVAFSLDFLAIAMSAVTSMSECRIEKLINPAMSGLPAFLAKEGGLNSGMMIVQVAAASLVSENKILSHPASVDSIPTSADKEDHVSMGTIAARKLKSIVNNSEHVTAMELLCAAQGIDFLKPEEPAAGVKSAYDHIRKSVSYAEVDRVFSEDILKVRNMIHSGEMLQQVTNTIGLLSL